MSAIQGHWPTAGRRQDRRAANSEWPGRPMVAGILGLVLFAANLAIAGPSLAANCGTPSHNASLSNGGASPGSGSPATTFVFSVSYADNAGCTPSVSLIIGGVGTFAMSGAPPPAGGTAVYKTTRSLPVGTWSYSFRATSGTGGGEITTTFTAVTPSTVRVSNAPPPTPPPPTPPPTAPPTPPPTAPPTPEATPKAAPNATPKPTPKPSTKPNPQPTVAGPSTTTPSPEATTTPTRTPRATATASPRPSDGTGVGGAGTTGGDDGDGPFGGIGGLLAFGATAVQLAEGPYLPITSWVASCLLGLLMFAFVLRRRQEQDDTERGFAMASQLITNFGAHADQVAIDDEPVDAETTIPRWRRPSVQAARQSGRAPAIVSLPVRFTTPARPGEDRRIVGYRLVRVGDSPDEVRSVELGRLDRDDEVEVLEATANWARVRRPDGLEGWVLAQTVSSSLPDPSRLDQSGR